MKNQTPWQVVDGKFVSGNNTVKMSCHHKKEGACGGCYARLITALTKIEESFCECRANASDVAADVFKALRAEKEGT